MCASPMREEAFGGGGGGGGGEEGRCQPEPGWSRDEPKRAEVCASVARRLWRRMGALRVRDRAVSVEATRAARCSCGSHGSRTRAWKCRCSATVEVPGNTSSCVTYPTCGTLFGPCHGNVPCVLPRRVPRLQPPLGGARTHAAQRDRASEPAARLAAGEDTEQRGLAGARRADEAREARAEPVRVRLEDPLPPHVVRDAAPAERGARGGGARPCGRAGGRTLARGGGRLHVGEERHARRSPAVRRRRGEPVDSESRVDTRSSGGAAPPPEERSPSAADVSTPSAGVDGRSALRRPSAASAAAGAARSAVPPPWSCCGEERSGAATRGLRAPKPSERRDAGGRACRRQEPSSGESRVSVTSLAKEDGRGGGRRRFRGRCTTAPRRGGAGLFAPLCCQRVQLPAFVSGAGKSGPTARRSHVVAYEAHIQQCAYVVRSGEPHTSL